MGTDATALARDEGRARRSVDDRDRASARAPSGSSGRSPSRTSSRATSSERCPTRRSPSSWRTSSRRSAWASTTSRGPSAGRDVAWHATLVHVALGRPRARRGVPPGAPARRLDEGAGDRALSCPGFALSAPARSRRVHARARPRARDALPRDRHVPDRRRALVHGDVGLARGARLGGDVHRRRERRAERGPSGCAVAASVPRAEWLTPTRLSRATVRAMLRFGLPMSVGTAAGFASRRVDNAIVSGLFGAGRRGRVQPRVQRGRRARRRRSASRSATCCCRRSRTWIRRSGKAALVRSTGLLALVTFPLAVGLGAVAPTLVAARAQAGVARRRTDARDALGRSALLRPIGLDDLVVPAGARPTARGRGARGPQARGARRAPPHGRPARAALGVLGGRLRVRASRAREHGRSSRSTDGVGRGVRSPRAAGRRSRRASDGRRRSLGVRAWCSRRRGREVRRGCVARRGDRRRAIAYPAWRRSCVARSRDARLPRASLTSALRRRRAPSPRATSAG